MTLTPLRHSMAVAVVVAGAATTVSMAESPTVASGSADRAPTSLSIRALKDAIRPGGTDTITGALLVAGSGAGAGRTVTLEAQPRGTDSFVPVGNVVAGDHGGLREDVLPSVTTRYRWHYAGDSDARPST